MQPLSDSPFERLQDLSQDFVFLEGANERYEYLIDLGKNLEPLAEQFRTDEWFVSGCQSSLWLKGSFQESYLLLEGYSPGIVAHALVALVINIFSGTRKDQIQLWNKDILSILGLKGQLTPTRAEAFESLVKRVIDLSKAQNSFTETRKVRLAATYENRFGGLERIYGPDILPRLKASRGCVVGLGGVGSWAVEALARSGIGNLTLIDPDDVCISNFNRQLPAIDGQVGQYKTTVMSQRIKLINPECCIEEKKCFLNSENLTNLLIPMPDFIIDAMDSVKDKAALIAFCKEKRIPLIVSGGAGGKTDPTKIKIDDLGRETGDSLLKAVKRLLKTTGSYLPNAQGLWEVQCVYSTQPSILPWEVCSSVSAPRPGARIDCASGFGATAFATGAFGLTLASWAVNTILKP